MSRVPFFNKLPIAADLCVGEYVSLNRLYRVVSSPIKITYNATLSFQ